MVPFSFQTPFSSSFLLFFVKTVAEFPFFAFNLHFQSPQFANGDSTAKGWESTGLQQQSEHSQLVEARDDDSWSKRAFHCIARAFVSGFSFWLLIFVLASVMNLLHFYHSFSTAFEYRGLEGLREENPCFGEFVGRWGGGWTYIPEVNLHSQCHGLFGEMN